MHRDGDLVQLIGIWNEQVRCLSMWSELADSCVLLDLLEVLQTGLLQERVFEGWQDVRLADGCVHAARLAESL